MRTPGPISCPTCRRHGMALGMVLYWIIGASSLLFISYLWTMHKSRMEQKITASIDHLYLAEGIFAREMTRLKRRPWAQRWYVPVGSTVSIAGASIIGTFQNPDEGTTASYTGYVQDVANYWDTTQGRLANHTDLFLRVTYPDGRPDATSRCFFDRVIFRDPTQLRPTASWCRRWEEVADFDPTNDGQRATVLAQVNQDEKLREHNRPASDIFVREIGWLASRGVSIRQIGEAIRRFSPRQERPWSLLATPAQADAIQDDRPR